MLQNTKRILSNKLYKNLLIPHKNYSNNNEDNSKVKIVLDGKVVTVSILRFVTKHFQ